MNRGFHLFFIGFALLLVGLSSSASATLTDQEVDFIFDWAQQAYPQHFPSSRPTLVSGPWRYRHWPETGVYAGERDDEIYVLGGPWGSESPTYIDTAANVLAQARDAIDDEPVPTCEGGAVVFDGEEHHAENGIDVESSIEQFSSDYLRIVDSAFDWMFDGAVTPEGGGPFYPGIFKVFDRNSDGLDDVLYVSSSFRWGYSGSGQSYGVLNYWENAGACGFVNRTEQLFGSSLLDVATRKIRFGDVNSDGIMDILLSNNQEDGRAFSDDCMDASNLAFISNETGVYDKVPVGIPAWTHHAEMFDIDYDGTIEVIDGNYNRGLRIYDLSPDGSWIETSEEYPNRDDVFNADDMALADFNNDGCVDVVATRKYPNSSDRTYHIGNCQGGFEFVEHFSVVSNVTTMPGESWNGDQRDFPISAIGGELFAGLANYWSHAEDYDGDGDIDLLYSMETVRVTQEEIENNFYVEGGEIVIHLVLLRNNSGVLEQEIVLQDGANNIGLFFARVLDANADGFPDLIVDDHHGWNNTATLNDVIYYNRGDGTFVKNTIQIASGELLNNLKSSVPIDFNNDGIMDFIVRSPCTENCTSNGIKLLEGISALPTP